MPPFSAVAAHLLKLVAQEGIEFRKVADTIRADAPLSADVLRIANSALFGPRYPVTGVLHAAVMLGIERVRSMVGRLGDLGIQLEERINALESCLA